MVAPLGIGQLEQRFFLEKSPYWWVFDYHKPKQVLGKFRDDDPDISESDDLVQYSWLQLEELLNSFPYAHVLVILKKSLTEPKERGIQLQVKFGEDMIPSNGGSSYQQQRGGGMAGGWQMVQFLMQQQQQHFNQVLQMQEEMARLNFENQRLVDAIEGSSESSLQEKILVEGMDILKNFVGRPKITPPPTQQAPAALGTMGQKKPEGESAKSGMSLDEVIKDLSAIRNTLPEYPINLVTRALAIFVQQNPDQAKMFIGPMIDQLQNHG